MAKMQLMEFMGRARDLEVLCYKQQQVVQGLERLLKQNKQKCYDEQKYLLKYKAKKSQAKEPDRAKLFWAGFMGIPALLGGVVYLVGVMLGEDVEEVAIIFSLAKVMGVIAAGILAFYLYEQKKYKAQLRYEEQQEQTKKDEIEKENIKIKEYNEKVIGSYRPRYALINRDIEKARNELIRIQQLKQDFYDRAPYFIHPDYRDFVPVCTFCNYLETRRCTELEGYMGVVNTYVQDLQYGAVMGKLDVIISKLDEIGRYQRAIVQSVRDTQQEVSRLCDAVERQTQMQEERLSQLQETAEMTAYYSEVTARCAEYQTFVEFWGLR